MLLSERCHICLFEFILVMGREVHEIFQGGRKL
jgi:hypothetical protein